MQSTTPLITDESSNTLKIVFNNLIQYPYNIKKSIGSLTYNGTIATTTPQATIQYIWSNDDRGNLVDLEQNITVDTLNIVAHYSAVLNQTVIDKNTGTGGTTETVPGLRIIKVVTSRGNITAVY